jgi:hypothetical protein
MKQKENTSTNNKMYSSPHTGHIHKLQIGQKPTINRNNRCRHQTFLLLVDHQVTSVVLEHTPPSILSSCGALTFLLILFLEHWVSYVNHVCRAPFFCSTSERSTTFPFSAYMSGAPTFYSTNRITKFLFFLTLVGHQLSFSY